MNLPTESQVSAAMRHVYTSAGTVLAIGTMVALVPHDQVQPIMDALQQVGDGLQKVFGGMSKLLVIGGPIVAVWMGKIAFVKAGFQSQLKSVMSAASEPSNVEQKSAVLAATAAIPEVEKIVAPSVAADVPSAKVVAN